MKRVTVLAAASAASALAAAIGHGAEEVGASEYARRMRQQTGTRGQRKVITRQAAVELAQASAGTVVLSHIHPRWLRRDVEALLDAGQSVTEADIEAMRKAGSR